MAEPVLRLEEIARTFNAGRPNEVPVLRGADLELRPGELVALTAPSGAGKSTLLHLCGLLDRPDTGEVYVDGTAAGPLKDRARTGLRRERLGFVYQFHHLLPEFTAAENVNLPQLAAGVPQADAARRASGLLEQVGLTARADHRPAALSGGEAQRVALCRALANRPAVLLADEPTGNLDPATAETVFQTLIDLVRDTGLAALVATHNPDLAARMDRHVRLDAGRLTG
ncbi:MAG: ABC transporter ATP-binding protein [Rhodobacteraceae bacterium]|nr:ABC transporter ATP-binding protein [Paracoccaceae bacterium]